MTKGAEEYLFERVFYAAALLVFLHDQPGMAADILKEAGLETWDCSDMDEFEKSKLRIINKEKVYNAELSCGTKT